MAADLWSTGRYSHAHLHNHESLPPRSLIAICTPYVADEEAGSRPNIPEDLEIMSDTNDSLNIDRRLLIPSASS